jgi:hypothetical protein
MPRRMQIEVMCPKCLAECTWPETSLGEIGKCDGCGAEFKIARFWGAHYRKGMFTKRPWDCPGCSSQSIREIGKGVIGTNKFGTEIVSQFYMCQKCECTWHGY